MCYFPEEFIQTEEIQNISRIGNVDFFTPDVPSFYYGDKFCFKGRLEEEFTYNACSYYDTQAKNVQ